MTELGFALFDTPIDCCGIVWNGRGIAGVQLPETDRRAVRNRILRRFPGACEAVPPADVLRVVDDIAALLNGEPRDLGYAKIDTAALLDFHRRVYDVARTIPAGATLSYGEVAARLGDRLLAREVGEALGQNPFPIIVPCHRVLAAGGKMGGFSGPRRRAHQAALALDRRRGAGRPDAVRGVAAFPAATAASIYLTQKIGCAVPTKTA